MRNPLLKLVSARALSRGARYEEPTRKQWDPQERWAFVHGQRLYLRWPDAPPPALKLEADCLPGAGPRNHFYAALQWERADCLEAARALNGIAPAPGGYRPRSASR